jgi:hypothetical protein
MGGVADVVLAQVIAGGGTAASTGGPRLTQPPPSVGRTARTTGRRGRGRPGSGEPNERTRLVRNPRQDAGYSVLTSRVNNTQIRLKLLGHLVAAVSGCHHPSLRIAIPIWLLAGP